MRIRLLLESKCLGCTLKSGKLHFPADGPEGPEDPELAAAAAWQQHQTVVGQVVGDCS